MVKLSHIEASSIEIILYMIDRLCVFRVGDDPIHAHQEPRVCDLPTHLLDQVDSLVETDDIADSLMRVC